MRAPLATACIDPFEWLPAHSTRNEFSSSANCNAFIAAYARTMQNSSSNVFFSQMINCRPTKAGKFMKFPEQSRLGGEPKNSESMLLLCLMGEEGDIFHHPMLHGEQCLSRNSKTLI